MTKLLALAATFALTCSTAFALDLKIPVEQVHDGQVLAVQGWLNLMPSPDAPSPPISSALKVTFAALSRGCTNIDSFKIELKKLASGDYTVVAVRTLTDPCQALIEPSLYSIYVDAPAAFFEDINSRTAKILVQPYVDVGVAH